MNDKIKSNLTNHYLMFVFDFGDPQSINKDNVLEEIKCPLIEIFKTQKQADKVKKILGKSGFNRVLYCYFDQFQNSRGIDFRTLGEELTENRKVFLRHLGKDKCSLLTLMIKISESFEKKGLLAA